jgi:hypothetical protein
MMRKAIAGGEGMLGLSKRELSEVRRVIGGAERHCVVGAVAASKRTSTGRSRALN